MTEAPAQRHVNPWIIAISVMLSTFIEVLDTTVVNVSLPHIAGSLSATIEEATWVLTSYLVANAIVLPITGWLANHFGRKRLLMFSVTGFTLASLLCGVAPTLGALIVFRLIQGACGGSLQPLSQAVLLEAFPPQDRGKAMGFWGLGIVAAPVMGPVLGGWLTDVYSWRWVFYINLPVGIASIVMTKLYIHDPPYIQKREGGIDYWGIGLLVLWIGALQLVLDKGQQEDWFASGWITSLTLGAAVFLILFLWRQLSASHPVVDLRVFRYRSFTTGITLMTLLGFGLYGSLVVLPVWLQTLMGYPAIQAGLAMAPRGLGSMLAMPLVGMFSRRADPRKLLGAGLTMAGLTMLRLSQLNLSAGYWDLFWPQFAQGFSLGLIFVPLTTMSMGQIPRQGMGNATSLYNLLRNTGGSIGIAGVTALQSRFLQGHINNLGSHVTVFDPAANQRLEALEAAYTAAGSGPVLAHRQALAGLYGLVQRQASMLSFVEVFHMLTFVFALMLPLVFLLKKPGAGGKSEVAVH
jgi:MFS transporter, DHA2 family, multidrug resistance protein